MMIWHCRICGLAFSTSDPLVAHLKRCVERHQDRLDELRTPPAFTGDPELAAFAAAEGDVYNRRPGTRRQPR
jgi:hypothetical protein